MQSSVLGKFITVHRSELLERCKAKVAERLHLAVPPEVVDIGIPLFLDQLVEMLEHELPNTRDIKSSASRHGRDLFMRGLTIGQVVHDYGDVCQSVTELAGEVNATFSTEAFRALNRCLDDAIAGAVTEFANQEGIRSGQASLGQSMALKNLVYTAITAFEAIQTGSVGITGNTGNLLHRSLLAMRELI
jgi:hypothetical protein